MNLVVIPFHDWKKCEREGFRTRDAHFMQEFQKHSLVNRLLVINRPISFAEIVLLRRNWRVKKGRLLKRKGGAYLSQIDSKTFVLDIVIPEVLQPILKRRAWIPYVFSQPRVVQAVRYALDYLDMDGSYALFISAPLFVPLIAQLSPPIFMLDAQDNLLKHALYRNVPDLAKYYQFCQERADVIFANSPETTQWLAQERSDAAYLSNGVDTEIFNSEKIYSVPEDMVALSRPIVGYAGKMQEMFDVVVTERVILEMKEVNFIFIGQKLDPGWVERLWHYPNAHYLGDKSYEMLPQYLSAFDICTIPYSMERQHGVDPIKFYEYLAMGKPIVTTNIGGVESFSEYPQVYIAENHDQYVSGLKTFVAQIQKGVSIPKRPIPGEYLWQTKADKIIRILDNKLREKLS